MPSDIAISVRNLTKTFRIFGHPGDRIKQALTLGRVRFHREFTAIKDVSFDIKKGETVGIIGRNGSGKSTLLQLICGITKPTSGTVTVNGRVSALLELGAGFNPEFTGRENVYFQGALMGFTKAQMDERFDDIVAFADIGGFIDQPVRMYSSGMHVRLAFSVAVSVNPDILVVDEALAVGDARFQSKCFRRIEEIRNAGGTILFVTHAMEQVIRVCGRASLLNRGALVCEGKPREVVNRYHDLLFSPPTVQDRELLQDGIDNDAAAADEGFYLRPGYNSDEYRFGSRAAVILDFILRQDGNNYPPALISGRPTEIILKIRFDADVERPVYGLAIKTKEGVTLFGANSRQLSGVLPASSRRAGEMIAVSFTICPWLNAGDYFASIWAAEEGANGIAALDRRQDAIQLSVRYPVKQAGIVAMTPIFRIESPHEFME